MPINLSNVNISIQQFQAVSNGEYNAGEVRLTSENTIGKVNHHVGWFFSNDTHLTHAEVLAVKDAFVRALANSGVDADGIASVRRDLGLAPIGAKDPDLARRSMKPLSRQQIRMILDEHAQEINTAVGEGMIRKESELMQGYTIAQRNYRVRTRMSVNEDLARSRIVVFDRGISDVQTIIAGDVKFRTADERNRLIDAAMRMKEHIIARSPNGVPSNEDGATMQFTRPSDGFTVTFALGGSDAEVVKRLDDILLLLRCSREAKAVEANPLQPSVPAYVPTLSTIEYRTAMRKGAEGNDILLTHEMKTMRAEVFATLRARFGADIVPENANFGGFINETSFNHAFGEADLGPRRSYDEMKALLIEGASGEAVRRVMTKTLKPMLQAAGLQPGKEFEVASTLLRRHPEMRNSLSAATSPDNVLAIIEQFRPQIEAGLRRQASIDRYRGASADWYREALANELHIPVSSLAGRAINTSRLSTTTMSLADKIGSGVNTADTDEQIEQAFRQHVANAVTERVSMLRQVEALQVFGEARDVMIETLLMANTVGNFDLAALKAAVDAIPVNDLVVALDAGTNDEIFTQMGVIARAATDAAKNAIGAHDGMLEEVGTAGKLALVMALAKRPEVFSLMRNFFLRPDIQNFNPHNLFHDTDVTDVRANANAFFDMFRMDEPIAESNAALANLLDKPGIPPVAARAVYHALDSLGFGDLSMEAKAKLLSTYDGKKIAEQVRKSTQAVTPDHLQALVRMQFVQEAARHALLLRVEEVARQNNIDSSRIKDFSTDVVFRRDRDLRGKLVAAITSAANSGKNVAAAVRALLAPQETAILKALRSFAEIRSVDATVNETAIRGISERAEIDRNVVETYLDTRGILIEGGSLSFLINDIKAKLSKPETDIEAWDPATVRQLAERQLQSFIDKKVGFIAAIRDLDVSDATKGALIVETLEQNTYTDRDFPIAAKAILARQEIKNAFKFAKSVLVAGKVEVSTNEELFGVLKDVSARFNEAIMEVLPEAKRLKMDNADYEVLRDILNAAFVDFCGDTLLAAAARLVAADRFAAIDEAGIAVHQRYNNDYMNAMSEINENGQVVPNHAAALAASKDAAAAALGRRLFGAIANALNDAWLPVAEANAVRKATATPEQTARAAAIVKRAPALLDHHAAGMDANQRAALKAFIITLDLRDESLQASEESIRAKVIEIKFATGFDVQGSVSARTALSLGYVPSELPTLERVADLYCKATGCTMAQARSAALDHTSPARRLYAYGGRFIESVENFRAGLALLGTFKNWFADTNATLGVMWKDVKPVVPEGASLTVLNASTSYFKHEAEYAYEKFIFEHLAIDTSIPLAADDPEKIFGMEHNPVTRFVGRAYVLSCVNTFAQIPPEKRTILFAVFDALAPLPRTVADLHVNYHGQINVEITARVLAHLDEIEAMVKNGTLTKESFCNQFLTDVPGAAGMTLKQIGDAITNKLDNDIRPTQLKGDYMLMVNISNMMQNSGCTIEEAVDAILANRALPLAPYVAMANGNISEFANDAKGGRNQMVMDLERPRNPSYISRQQLVLEEAANVFTVVFPDGTSLRSASTADATKIADKIATLCGSVHPAQLNAVYFALTQASTAPAVGAFTAQDINVTEHMPLTYTLSKNAETGAVTVRYSEPAGFPVKFHWDTTIGLDGISTSTPIVVE